MMHIHSVLQDYITACVKHNSAIHALRGAEAVAQAPPVSWINDVLGDEIVQELQRLEVQRERIASMLSAYRNVEHLAYLEASTLFAQRLGLKVIRHANGRRPPLVEIATPGGPLEAYIKHASLPERDSDDRIRACCVDAEVRNCTGIYRLTFQQGAPFFEEVVELW